LVAGTSEVVGYPLARRLRSHDDQPSGTERVFVDGLRAGARGRFGFVERGSPGRQHVPTIDDESNDGKKRDGERHDERGDGPGLLAITAGQPSVPR
jgi:hypothetical protein